MNIRVRACVQTVHLQHAHMISDGHATGQLQRQWCPGQSQTNKHFCRLLMSWNLGFIHSLLY